MRRNLVKFFFCTHTSFCVSNIALQRVYLSTVRMFDGDLSVANPDVNT